MKFHFIAIGGSVMHSLALSLHQAGHQISGSDDQLYDPARSRLAAAGLLPAAEGWDPSRIHAGLDGVVLGMHAFEDNPELSRARELGIPVYSYPEFIYERSRNKHRIVDKFRV
ncbi:MAG: peptidoglycan synthetase, partial [Bacteroidetes bacterium]